MKRKDLVEGEIYALDGSTSLPVKAKLVDAKAVRRYVMGSWRREPSVNADAARFVVEPDNKGSLSWRLGSPTTSEDITILTTDTPGMVAKKTRLAQLHDEPLADGRPIVRVPLGKVLSTWADYEVGAAAAAKARQERLEANRAREVELRVEIARLPEELQEFFMMDRYAPARLRPLESFRVEELLEALLEVAHEDGHSS